MNTQRLSITKILYLSDICIRNSIASTTIYEAVSQLGYDKQELETGRAMHNELTHLVEHFDRSHSDLKQAYYNRIQAQKQVATLYKRHLSIARIAFREDSAATIALDLKGIRATQLSRWINQCRSFYTFLQNNENWLKQLERYNIKTADLQNSLELVNKVEKLEEKVRYNRGISKDSTYKRNQKAQELGQWVNDYLSIARIALSESPQMLEALGVVVKN